MSSITIRRALRAISNVSGLITLLVLFIAVQGNAIYQIQRPITSGGGKVYQPYLWGVLSADGVYHRGIDFVYPLDTDIYAVASGKVVNLREDLDDGDMTTDWGNYVVIQHSQRHYDRTTDRWAYVYSVYLHLSRLSVRFNVGDQVNAGDWIAEVDDTGQFSNAHHLHLQIVIHPEPDRTIWPDFTLDPENRSRNPELWLSPYNGSTGAVIGKVTDNNGNPVPNLIVHGLQKPVSGYNGSRTYSNAVLNPDDIFGENFGTTDVTPGTYQLVARNLDGSEYRALGSYTVRANQITFVGLYPVYLPDIKTNNYGWNSSIIVRNNSTSRTADVNTTFFSSDGYVTQSAHNSIPPRGSVTISQSGCFYCQGSAAVVASEDVSVVVVNVGESQAYSYNGIAPSGGVGNPGFGTAGNSPHLPLVMLGHSSWYSDLAIQNLGMSSADTTIYFGTPQLYSPINTNGMWFLNRYVLDDVLVPPFLGSARISANQPVAAVASHLKDTSTAHVAYAHSAFTSGHTTNHLPLVFRTYNPTSTSGWCTGIDVRNLGLNGANVTLTYRPTNMGGTFTSTKWVPGNSGTNFWLPSLAGFPDGSFGVATLSSSEPLISVANTTKYASDVALSYNGFLGTDGTGTVILPLVYRGYSGWDTGVQIHNVGNQATNVRIDYYTTSGAWQCANGPFAVAAQQGYNFYQPTSCLPAGFRGSAVVTADGGDRRIVGQVNAMNYGAGYAVSYNGANR